MAPLIVSLLMLLAVILGFYILFKHSLVDVEEGKNSKSVN